MEIVFCHVLFWRGKLIQLSCDFLKLKLWIRDCSCQICEKSKCSYFRTWDVLNVGAWNVGQKIFQANCFQSLIFESVKTFLRFVATSPFLPLPMNEFCAIFFAILKTFPSIFSFSSGFLMNIRPVYIRLILDNLRRKLTH